MLAPIVTAARPPIDPRRRVRQSVPRIVNVKPKGARLRLVRPGVRSASHQLAISEAAEMVGGFKGEFAGFALVGWSTDGGTYTAVHWAEASPYKDQHVAHVVAALVQERLDEG